jgi:hypothetical protein
VEHWEQVVVPPLLLPPPPLLPPAILTSAQLRNTSGLKVSEHQLGALPEN